MDGDRQNQETQVGVSWIPETPHKPLLPKSAEIWADQQGQHLKPPNLSGPKGFSSAFPSETRADMQGGCFDFANCNYKAAIDASLSVSGDLSETCRQFSMGNTAISFGCLMGLADAASGASNSNSSHHPHDEHSIHHGPAYDLNFPPRSRGDSSSSMSSYQFAPVTPDKTTSEYREVVEMRDIYTNERPSQEVINQENAVTGVVTTPNQTDKELQNYNTVKGGGEVADRNRAQQKPRRKKHRPKVITESKPRTQKSAISKPSASNENPTGKRKYVRKNAHNESSSTPTVEVTGESTDTKISEPGKKSCRRALNFDTEGQPETESSKCKTTSTIVSDPWAQDSIGGNQSKTTVSLGHGVEIVVEKTKAGFAYDFNHSVNQKHNEYLALYSNRAPRTPVHARTSPSWRKQGVNSQENQIPEMDWLIANNVQEKASQNMLQTDYKASPISPNNFNCCTKTTLNGEAQAKESKRRHCISTEQNICIINFNGMHYNTVSAYGSGYWAECQKKKRTKKGQHSTATTSSFVQQPNEPLRLETACSDKDPVKDPFASRIPGPNSNAIELNDAFKGASSLQHPVQTLSSLLSLKEGSSTRKKSRGPTQAQHLASLTEVARGQVTPAYPSRQVAASYNGQQVGNLPDPHSCIDAFVADMHLKVTKKKRTKKRISLIDSASSSKNNEQMHRRLLCIQNQFPAQSLVTSRKKKRTSKKRNIRAPPEAIWKQIFNVDPIVAIAEGFKHLDINNETTSITCREQNAIVPYFGNEKQKALVLYRGDGTMVPFEDPFAQIKKQLPRPKVDLDAETNRVWKLLLGNINSEGIDGTDEEKVKWWEEERKVFQGRTNSFIARMHLVQGDRRFTQWKGSVVDSVVGVFLTQNVSDHLSSSAFMSLAAHFPSKTNSECKLFHDEKTSSENDKPIVCIENPDDTTKWNEMSNHSICDQGSMTLRNTELDEEREVVNSNEFSGSSTGIISSGAGTETCFESKKKISNTETTETGKMCYAQEEKVASDAFSSQNSVVSSQNSVDTLIIQTAEREDSFSENNSGEDMTVRSNLNSLNASISFMELLQKVDVCGMGNRNFTSNQDLKYIYDNTQCMENDYQSQKMEKSDVPGISSGLSMVPSNNHHMHISNSRVTNVEHVVITEEARYSGIYKDNVENIMKDQTAFTKESASQISDHNFSRVQEASRPFAKNPSVNNIQEDIQLTAQSQNGQFRNPQKSLAQIHNNEIQQSLCFQNHSGAILDVIESTGEFNHQGSDSWKTTESNLTEHSKSKGLEEINAAKRKAKSRRVGDEIKDNVDWDALRKHAEANGQKRERTADTMDSLDWEAVRCADVAEIANTIKDRGMNNVLGGRIKDFLNRLVREHGSIDLEWLRDVPPDKAKEYLLSIRGLGLKSVECVRLLTLHHLAFPVDTNVGRIAVRLGWVPLQPLPESLQLHLLEMYPVLESIQKYLWPRLCKLDQRTLYELHYQMITFGKVFCTKSKPNCNACPMRGECRHFASAFASARLALPGPEEKRIVSASENRTKQSPSTVVDQLHLPLLLETEKSVEIQLSEANQESEKKLRVSNCKPIVEEPSSPELQCPQVTENDMEDMFYEDPDEIPTIKLNIEEFSQNLQNYMQTNMELQDGEMSKALVALTAEAANIPMPKLKNVSQLRTEHNVYELPDSHPLVQGLDRREPDDPCSYLLAIWTPGETADSIQPPQGSCNAQEYGTLCDERTCFSCNSIREANSQIVRGTLLIPCRTAMRGSFPLNGTYFQVNEVFADHDSSLNPIDVPRAWIWNLPRRTVYFGTSIPSIFKGLTTEGIQQCFWRGYVCVRGFDQKTRAPRPLIARLHFPASRLNKTKGKSGAVNDTNQNYNHT